MNNHKILVWREGISCTTDNYYKFKFYLFGNEELS